MCWAIRVSPRHSRQTPYGTGGNPHQAFSRAQAGAENALRKQGAAEGAPAVIASAFADQNSKEVVEVRLGGLDEDTLMPAFADGNRPIPARIGPALLRRPVHPAHLREG